MARRSAHLTDAQVLLKASTDPAAFETLFVRHVSAIHGYVARGLPPALVEDVVSETFAVAFEWRAHYHHESPDARPWLFWIATNLIRRQRRSEVARLRAYARFDPDEACDGTEAAAVSRADAHAMRSELATALSRLNCGDRDTLLLLAWAEMSYEEIAQALGIPVGTVGSRINRARRILRELLANAPDSTGPGFATRENGGEPRYARSSCYGNGGTS
jgi:RNA polymerase sigma-70 factor (ECF subfamily)